MTTLYKINHIYIICDKEKEEDKYKKWEQWIIDGKFKDGYVEFFSYKWGTELTDEDIKEYSNDDGTLVKLYPFRAKFPLKKSEISLGINFMKILKLALKDGYENILVFESDAILHPDFVKKFNLYMKNVLESYSVWHLLSIGCGMNKHSKNIKKNKHIYMGSEMRCNDSLVFNSRAMKIITENIPKLKLPIDEHFDILVKTHKLIVLWAEPTIVVQGSQTGINPTTIRSTDSVYVKDCEWLKDVKYK
jgi:hypothetical protein